MKKRTKILRVARGVSLAALLAAVWASISFGLTFLYSLIPEANDGIIGPSLLMRLLWGEDGWTRVRYFAVFRGALLVSFALLAVTLILFAVRRKEKSA